MLAGAESEMTYFVDAGTGTLNGRNNLYGGVVGFLENLHDGALTCEGFAGYTPWLSSPAPVASLSPFEEMTWGAVLLAIAGAALVFLAATAPFIWWPGLRRWRNAFRLRWRSGRYARDFDLHNVIGIVALVPLLVWGLTGLNFEVPGFRDVWDFATGGQSPPEDNYTMEASENPRPPITLGKAMQSAVERFPGLRLLDAGPNLWAHNAVYEDNVCVFLGPSPTVSNAIADERTQPALHYGTAVNGYWRALWFVLGFAPLLLSITGVSTWLYRRRVKRGRRAAEPNQPIDGEKSNRTDSATASNPMR
jgi:hypothetical protein